jgi:hypothetical protein
MKERIPMLKRVLFTYSLTVFSFVPAFAGGVPTTTSMTADQLIRKNVAARGGDNAWQQVSTMTMTGRMDVGKGLQVPYTMDLKRGRKVRVVIVFAGKTAVQVYDGAKGWKVRPFLGRNDVEPYTPEEQQKAAMDSDIDGLLVGYAAKGTKAQIEGVEKVEGRDAYKVKLVLKGGQERRVWIDAETYLELKIDGTRRLDGKPRMVSTYFRDYRTVNGLMVPFVFETAVDGVKTSEKIDVEKVVVNPKLDDALFAKLR